MDVFIKAAEFMEIPVRRSDDEPLQKLFVAVRSELNLDLKNIKTEQAKFLKQHRSVVKVILRIYIQQFILLCAEDAVMAYTCLTILQPLHYDHISFIHSP